MKKIFITIFAFLSITLSAPQAHAIPVSCINCIPDFLIQIKNFVESTISSGANVVTSVNQTLETVNDTILKPMKDAMTLMQIAQNGNMINNLITGSDALLVGDPALLLKNKDIAFAQGGIDALAKSGGIFSSSILGSVVTSAKSRNSSLDTKIASINKSSIPAIEQNKVCGSDASLSAMAKNQAKVTGGDYTDIKTQIYNSLCACNPNTDSACAKKLVTASNQNPSLDVFYAITQGDNAYVKEIATKQAIEDEAAAAKERAKSDLASGGGIKSKTNCKKKASNGMCLEETVEQASNILNNTYKQALDSGLNTAISSFGSGAGSLIGNAFSMFSLLKGIQTGIGGLTGGSGGSSGGSSGSVGTISDPRTTGSNKTTTTSATYTQDLLNNQKTKETVTSTPTEQLARHDESLARLSTIDNDYKADIASYRSQLENVKGCFNDLARDYPNDVGAYQTRISAADSYYTSKKSSLDTRESTITAELAKIDIAKTLIATTRNAIAGSNSTEEISQYFKDYQDQIKTQNLPDMTADILRKSEAVRISADLQTDNAEGGNLYNLRQDCSQIRSSIEYERNRSNGA